jgi:6,7-dimethyl-8-ribityllumazine synthase
MLQNLDPSRPFLLVEARFYQGLSDALLAGASAVLEAHAMPYTHISLPGALEIPAAIAWAARTGRYQGFVALGVVIRGETYHFEVVANESARALMQLSLTPGLALGNGILTCESEAQAWERADPRRLNKGGAAAQAALCMAQLANSLAAHSPAQAQPHYKDPA